MQVETKVEKQSETDFFVYVKNLPSFIELKEKVDEIVLKSTWFEKYGVDWCIIFIALACQILGIVLSSHNSWNVILLGGLLIGFAHGSLTYKSAHIASHGSLCESKRLNYLWTWIFGELIASTSMIFGYDIHIKQHHPYTNIVDMGDSSVWKAPMIPRYMHMFLSPLFLPILGPLVSIQYLIFKPLLLVCYIVSATFGMLLYVAPLVYFGGYTWLTGLAFILACRTVMTISYLHVNIFQHIGLSMYSKEDKPTRLYQMCSGVLNLHSVSILDYSYGHSLVSCHVEHHLFPKLSDNMCLKVKPVVKSFIKKHGLPYNEDSYQNRLKYFLDNYDTLMVNAPPITHYVGLQ